MGMFDPAWRKLAERSPHWFRSAINDWDDETNRWLSESGVPGNGSDLCKSFIYGRVAQGLQAATGAWSPDAATFVAVQTRNADKLLPHCFRGAVLNIVGSLWREGLFRAAYGGLPPNAEPRDGQSRETAVIVTGAADNTLAVGALLLAATHGDLALRRLQLDRPTTPTMLTVDYTYVPALGLPKDRTLHFEVRDGDPPSTSSADYERLKHLPMFAQ